MALQKEGFAPTVEEQEPCIFFTSNELHITIKMNKSLDKTKQRKNAQETVNIRKMIICITTKRGKMHAQEIVHIRKRLLCPKTIDIELWTSHFFGTIVKIIKSSDVTSYLNLSNAYDTLSKTQFFWYFKVGIIIYFVYVRGALILHMDLLSSQKFLSENIRK